MSPPNIQTVAIIGGGVAGLASARTLIAIGLDCTVYERSAVPGGVWSDGYLNFGVQVQKELYEFPDWPLPEDAPNFTPGPFIQQYLSDYADHFGVTQHIRLNTVVTRVEEMDGPDSGWIVSSRRGGETHTERFDLVVVCIGLYSDVPHVPEYPGRDRFDGRVIHNAELKSPDQLVGQRVAVVGFGKGATDAALESAAVAASTHIVFRQPHWPIPQKLAGVLPFKWGLLNRLTSTLLPPYQSMTAVEKVVHGPGKPLVWLYWRLVEALIRVQCRMGPSRVARVSLVPDTPIEIDAFGESTMVPRPAFYRLAREGTIGLHRTTISQFTETGLELADGERLDVDLVILATGWKTDLGFITPDVLRRLELEADGFYLYRHMLNPAVPRLIFIGRAASISSILTYCLQAHWLARWIQGRLILPSDAAMKKNIAEMKQWKRAWIPFGGARSARLIAHTQHYHDELLRDIRQDPLRKTGLLGPLKELVYPYQPSDYATLIASISRE